MKKDEVLPPRGTQPTQNQEPSPTPKKPIPEIQLPKVWDLKDVIHGPWNSLQGEKFYVASEVDAAIEKYKLALAENTAKQ